MDNEHKIEYRVVRQTQDGEEWLSIQEVYFDGDKMYAHTIDLEVTGESVTDLRKQLQSMLWAIDKDILDQMPDLDDGMEMVDVETTENITYIYESPDGGKTLYRREAGKDNREKIEKTL